MTNDAFLRQLIEYFSSGGKKYPLAVTDEILRFSENIDNADRLRIWEYLRDNQKANFMVSVADIKEACEALKIGYQKTYYVEAEKWVCDACGNDFLYAITSTDDDMIGKHIFRRCPRCGMFPEETKVYNAYGGASKAPPGLITNYAARVQLCLARLQSEGKYWNEATALKQKNTQDKISFAVPDKKYNKGEYVG